jgi:hypothetical protein
MSFVYHTRPAELRGTTIEPLSALRAAHPDLHAAAAAKYAGARVRNLAIRVPILDVMWDDLVHLLPLHPGRVYRAQRAAGLEPAPQTFFRIPVGRLPPEKTLWFRFGTVLGLEEQLGQPPDDEFAPFDAEAYRELAEVPGRAAAYYRAAVAAGLRPSPFRFIPQVLVAAPIEVAGVEMVEWAEPAGGFEGPGPRDGADERASPLA